VEAMSRAVPAIGTRTGGIPELLGPDCTHGRRDHRHLAALVERLVRHPDELKACARRNWQAAHEFAADALDRRRNAFLARFREFAERARAVPGPQRPGPPSSPLRPSTATTGR
jgi:glycosyltransferase involved in cell wall biosynthesis